MIIRILSEGQFDLPDDAVDVLNQLDIQVEQAIESQDESAFRSALAALLLMVRELGEPVAVDALLPSDLVLPTADSELAEVRDLLGADGLIPG